MIRGLSSHVVDYIITDNCVIPRLHNVNIFGPWVASLTNSSRCQLDWDKSSLYIVCWRVIDDTITLVTYHLIFLFGTRWYSGWSRVSRRGGVDLVGGGVDSRGGYVLKILYVKTKELGPLGGRTWCAPLDLPMVYTENNAVCPFNTPSIEFHWMTSKWCHNIQGQRFAKSHQEPHLSEVLDFSG